MRLNIEINEKLQEEIKNYSLKNKTSIKKLITELIEERIYGKSKKVKEFIVSIVCGGTSEERGISLNSARSVADHLENDFIKIKVFYVDKNKNFYLIDRQQLYSNTPSDFDFKLAQNGKFLSKDDFISELKNTTIVFPTIHGEFGEDGELQKLLEDNNIAFVGAGSKACKTGFSKINSSIILNQNGFYTFPFVFFEENKKENEKIIKRFFELNKLKKAVVKPANGGSSIGVYCVYSYSEAIEKVELLFKKNMKPIIIEPFCVGREFTTILLQNLNTKKPVAIFPSEIEMKYENYQIFDYRRKYLPTTQTRCHTPARFNEEEIEKIQNCTEEIFKIFNFEDVVRIDGWLLNDGRIWFSDINIAPGMEQNSFVFQQASRIGFTHKSLLIHILKSACLKYNILLPEEKEEKQNKKNVFVLFGGDNAERQVSLMSGSNVWLKLLKSKKYLPTPFLLDKDGSVWELPYSYLLNHTVEEIAEHCKEAEINKNIIQKYVNKVCEKLEINNFVLEKPINMSFEEFMKKAKVDNAFVFLGLHGGKGEDGTIQHKLTEQKLFFNGSDEYGSKLGMDKFETGKIINNLKDEYLITAPKEIFSIDDFCNYNIDDYLKYWEKITKKLNSNNFIIKPAKDGSSAGAVRIFDCNELKTYIEILKDKAPYIPANTFKNQNNIVEMPSNTEQGFLLESFIDTDDISVKNNQINYTKTTGWIELTVGVIEKDGVYHSFNPSITIAENKILSVEEKFQGGTGINITPPPNNIISEELNDLIKKNIEKSAKTMGLKNYARLDIFVNVDNNKIILIEANTLPALTPSTVIFHQALEEKEKMIPLEFIEKIIELKIL